MTQDPIGLDGGFNLYRYVPNPTSWVDPWGWVCNKPGGIKPVMWMPTVTYHLRLIELLVIEI
ncbi:RHS repeat-associated core domain-containing protein [Lactiplantibacillus plantarum]|uniref:RHS repeat-associated core domain-containing protein n=1 Tax=Lactiplantibacillus plantarum TaxID=1590 RepID=UPI00265A5E4A|nr:RHS repeat-associated core domain-containing protein [Lactiplantibacillus plantarum]WKF80892.1 RHS repeat-associated core domain-containing protein [Lactiplantibacillus plantarum]WKF89129.1 RHS repeat-associated core domain-containing protein [Lactiplantibacillus plantarum]